VSTSEVLVAKLRTIVATAREAELACGPAWKIITTRADDGVHLSERVHLGGHASRFNSATKITDDHPSRVWRKVVERRSLARSRRQLPCRVCPVLPA
jgi:hypothetical protein